MKKKALCDFSKQTIRNNIEQIIDVVVDANFICTKCARTSNDSDYLCKAEKIKKLKG
jgi:hypothetical protein